MEAQQPPPQSEQTQTEQNKDTNQDLQPQSQPDTNKDASPPEEIQEIGSPFKVRKFTSEKDNVLRSGSGRRSRTRSATKQGRYVKSTPRRSRNDLALDATLRAAAPFQMQRTNDEPEKQIAVHIKESDIREKIRERRVGNALVFLVDGSGSMGAQRRMVETKAAIMSLLLDAYQKRDKICMIVFRGSGAEVLLPLTGSVDLAGKLLADLPIGGRTPLSAGLSKTSEVLMQIFRKSPTSRPLVLMVTDGKANAGLGDAPPHQEAISIAARMKEKFENVRFVVIDTEPQGVVRFNLAGNLATVLDAEYFHPETLRAEDLVRIAKNDQ
jgi:magnesium chelatase subunit D